jgi:cytochrome c-type biogenesis protein
MLFVEKIFVILTNAFQGSSWMALGASLAWGALSVLLSPCHLSSIPLIIGFISDQGTITTRKAFGMSFLFGLGIIATIAVIGVITSAMGRMLGDVGRYGNYAVAAVFFLVGLYLMDIVSLSFSGPSNIKFLKKGFFAAFLLGLIFGIALGPCTFAYMAPVLTMSLKVASADALFAALLLAAYGLGHCSVIVVAGSSTEAVQRYLNWNERSKGISVLKKVCGFLVILGGFYLILTASGR